jgi:hypothetical protein
VRVALLWPASDPASPLRELLRRYVAWAEAALKHPPTVNGLLSAAAGPQTQTWVAFRGEQMVGLMIVSQGVGGTGADALWIDHFFCPGDLPAARALVATAETQARFHQLPHLVFESTHPNMKRIAALAGFRPVATVYGKEV